MTISMIQLRFLLPIFLVLFFGGLAMATFLGTGFLFGYRLNGKSFQYLVFHFIPIYSVRFANIARVRRYKRGLNDLEPIALLRTLRLSTRVFAPALVIEKPSGYIRFVIFSPPDIGAFIDAFRAAGITVDE